MSDDVSTPNDEYEDMAEYWELPHTLLGGTRAMREAGEKYLPREAQNVTDPDGKTIEAGEDAVSWRRRRDRTVLFNAYGHAVSDLTGRVFVKPMILRDKDDTNTPLPIKWDGWVMNMDLLGNDLNTFSYKVFRHLLVDGKVHILVDVAALHPEATRADAAAAGARPYAVVITAQDMIGWQCEVNSQGVIDLVQARFRQSFKRPSGRYGTETVDQIRVMEPGRFEIHERVRKEHSEMDDHGGYVLIEEGTYSLDHIPIVTIYTDMVAPMVAYPPLMDLAEKNVEHWQSSSDQRNILHIGRVPLLFASGIDLDQAMLVGSRQFSFSTNPDARLSYTETSGESIGAGRDDLRDIRQEMQELSLQPLTQRRTGTPTATEAAIGEARARSPLQVWKHQFKQGMEKVLELMEEWDSANDMAPIIDMATDEGLVIDNTDLELIIQLWAQNGLSLETVWEEFKRRGKLSHEFDPVVELERLLAQMNAMQSNQEEVIEEEPGEGGIPEQDESTEV